MLTTKLLYICVNLFFATTTNTLCIFKKVILPKSSNIINSKVGNKFSNNNNRFSLSFTSSNINNFDNNVSEEKQIQLSIPPWFTSFFTACLGGLLFVSVVII